MIKKITILILMCLIPTLGHAQGIFQGSVSEGETGFLPVTILDEEGVPVQPQSISFFVTDGSGTSLMAGVQTCIGSGSSDCDEVGGGTTNLFNGATDTDANMVLVIPPRANRMTLTGHSSENHLIVVWATYPHGCLLTTGSTSQCKSIVALHRYTVHDRTGLCVNPTANSGLGALEPEPCS